MALKNTTHLKKKKHSCSYINGKIEKAMAFEIRQKKIKCSVLKTQASLVVKGLMLRKYGRMLAADWKFFCCTKDEATASLASFMVNTIVEIFFKNVCKCP